MRGDYKKKTWEQVESDFNAISYEGAIAYYKGLANQVYSYIEKISNSQTASIFMETLSEVIENELSKGTNKGKILLNDIIYKKLPEKMADVVYKNLLEEDTNGVIEELKQEYLNIKDKDSEEGKKEARKILDAVVKELNITDNLITFLKRQNKLTRNVINFNDIKSQLPAFQRSMIKEFFETGQKGSGRKGGNLATIAGYYAESIIADAIYNYLASLKIKPSEASVKQVGNIKINGKDTPVDILFGQIFGCTEKQLQNKIKEFNGVIDIDNSLTSFGIQAKRTALHSDFFYKKDIKKGMNENARIKSIYSTSSTVFKIGERGGLYEAYRSQLGKEKSYYWIEAAQWMSKTENVKEALGAGNVMWVTHDQAMWTYDFINAFVRNRTRLNFDFKLETRGNKAPAYKATSLIVLAFHNNNLRSSLINKGKFDK